MRVAMRRVVVVVLVCSAVALAGLCVPAGATAKTTVVAAFYPVAYAVQRVGGDRVSVTNLTPAGAEPHDLELTPAQMDTLLDAKAVFVMGHRFQPAVEKAARERSGLTMTLLDRLPINAAN